MRTRPILLAVVLVALLPRVLPASEPLRRYLLAIGANEGGLDRVSLRYAVSDAERFAQVMVRMGGVEPTDRVVLRDPGPAEMDAALADVTARIAASSASGRTEVIVYYSGHADESGLRIGSEHVPYTDLRSRIEAIPAAVRITILDACASGAITRFKGGQRRQPFLVDASSNMEGYAFLTSSSGDESAQESDAIGSSFFTHYLVSGLRGAADLSGDGRVSLTEAYQFAFNETLARTTETMGGAQHPAYHINLQGTGDVVMTDVRRTSAGLLLGKELHGRFFVRDGDEHLVAELYKPRGRQMVLGLEAGRYKIHLERDERLFLAKVDLGLESLLALEPSHFEAAERTPAVARGDAGSWPPRPGFMGPLVGRSRIQLTLGKNGRGVEAQILEPDLVSAQAATEDLFFGLGYARWIREDLTVGVHALILQSDVGTSVGVGVTSQVTSLVSIRVGVRKYLPPSMLRTPVRPFVSLGVGALIGSESRSEVSSGRVTDTHRSAGAFGPELGAGLDFLIARRFMLGMSAAYILVTDFSEPVAGRKNYSSLELGVSLSWLFGRGLEG